MSVAEHHQSFSYAAFEVPPTAVTLEGFREWASSELFPQRGRVTFVNGRLLVDMSPERFESQHYLKREITFVLESLTRELGCGEVFPDGAWFTNTNARVSNEPDVMYASWETLKSGKLKPVPEKGRSYDELVGTPDWVCEIVSDASVRTDKTDLRQAYFDAGITEYWLLDARGDEIDFKLLIAGSNGYAEVEPDGDVYRASSVFKRSFRITRQRDELDRWRYRVSYR